jgi:hypothetical protein
MSRYIVAQRLTATPSARNEINLDLDLTGDIGLPKFEMQSMMRSFVATDRFDRIEPPEPPPETVVLDIHADEAAAKQRELQSEAIIEPEKLRWHGLCHPLAVPPAPDQTLPHGFGAGVELRVTLDGEGLEGALAMMYLSGRRGGFVSTSAAVTDKAGRATILYDPKAWVPVNIAVTPRSRAWTGYTPVVGGRANLAMTALPRSGPLGWWHRALGVQSYLPELGSGIRVGIIDTGLGPHPYLEHARSAGSIVGGRLDATAAATTDVAEHGTHVAGIIGARPTDTRDFAGLAPGADLVALRVYPGDGAPGQESGFATNGDIAQAILRLARDEQCDLINLSSGGPLRSEIEIDRITAAFNFGTLVICAAGNGSGPPVLYPAAEPNVIAVSALGVIGAVPPVAMDVFSAPSTPDRYNQAGGFLAAFSSFGPEIKCIGPGVGLISTVPMRGEARPAYLAASGTSMAAPAVTGALAALLSRDPVYRSLPRNRTRSLRAWRVLAGALRSLGLYFPYQGFGMPTIAT